MTETTKFESKHSLWMVDEDAKMATRLPKTEAPTHPEVGYDMVGAPRAFESIAFFGTDQVDFPTRMVIVYDDECMVITHVRQLDVSVEDAELF
jgi:hypothetical protein